jgi:GMP synthase-like glutamine amidotransferase
VIASSDFCPHAAYAIGDQVLCFQGHPESASSQAILDLRREIFSELGLSKGVKAGVRQHQAPWWASG